uniref:Penicillin acylase family protein n=1 Tax=Steinernema glaseri TaxID=37863 RepID=A0A1I7YCB5_9BILA
LGNHQDSVIPTSGVQPLKGLAQNVSVRRNALGMPLIESSSFHDALFTLGYVHAGDRIGQMVGMRLLAQGRLAEMAGPDALESGYRPEYWKPEDSALIFSLYSFSQSVNLQEEIAALTLAQKVGADTLPWLLPSYPDEPLAMAEADKLKGLNPGSQLPGLATLNKVSEQLAALNLLGTPASSNWAIAPQRSRSGRSLLASDSQGAWALSPVQ